MVLAKQTLIKRHFVILLLLVGFALRIYALNDITMTGDDRNVIQKYLSVPFLDLFSITTLHGFPEHTFANILIWSANKVSWQLFMLRWPGVMFGVLTLAITYTFIKKIADPLYATIATYCLTFSYYHISISHQVRGYAEMVFLAITAFYFLWCGMTATDRWRAWILFALTSALSIYNHIYTVTLLTTQGIIIAIWLALRAAQQGPTLSFWRRQIIPPLLSGIGSVALAALLFAPLLPKFFTGFTAAKSDFTLKTVSFTDSLLSFRLLFHHYSSYRSNSALFLFFLGSLLLGLVYLLKTKPQVAALLSGWFSIPLLLAVCGESYVGWFYARERYLIFIFPAFIFLTAAGWAGLIHIVSKAKPTFSPVFSNLSCLLIFIVSATALAGYFPPRTEGNWHDAARYLATHARSTDMILCEPFAHGWADIDLPITDECTQNITYNVNQQTSLIYPVVNLYALATYDMLTKNSVLLQRNPRIWIVLWQAPSAPIDYHNVTMASSFHKFGHTLILGPIAAENTIQALEQSLAQVNTLNQHPLTHFALLTRMADLQAALGQTELAAQTLTQAKQYLPDAEEAQAQIAFIEQHRHQPPLIATPAHPLAIRLGEQILLRGYSLAPELPSPGQTLQLSLFWQALTPIKNNYAAFLHLRNADNQTVAQLDFFPNRPTASWWINDTLDDTHSLPIPPALPPGQYRLLIGLYDPQTLTRLAVADDKTGENAIELTRFNYQ